ncbi:LysR family transcriptional regulator [Mangrovitalea sediminis]|uniref:LysR family transcriptional regulator n=1 Tax=Mangrovitalea sediminis TaxID=1982043 RepID=UPI0018E9F55C|nr:LysR family transcriptional regulator [Mangrovitalea sediminis]
MTMPSSPLDRRHDALSLRQIRYFIAVAESESVSRAAQELCISQSAITAAIQTLEHELDAALFTRHARGVRLTREGHRFLRHANHIVAAIADARRAISSNTQVEAGELNIGVTRMVSGYYLADYLARFNRLYPQIRVRVVEDERDYIEHLLVNGELDVGLLLVSNLRNTQALDHETLVRSPWRVWLPTGHPLLELDALELADIADEPLILLGLDELSENTSKIWADVGLTPRVMLRTEAVEAIRSLVGMGVGIATLPDMAYRPWSLEGDRLEARQIVDPIPTVDVGVVWCRGAPMRPATSLFLKLCREHTPDYASASSRR